MTRLVLAARWACFVTSFLTLALANSRAPAAQLYSVTDLGDLPSGSDTSNAVSINGSGQIAGWSHTSTGLRAFRWTSPGPMLDLGVLPSGFESQAFGINDTGQVVGRGDTVTGDRAF